MVREKAKRLIDRCPHVDKPYYAKGMCNRCYHLFGRPNISQCVHAEPRMNFAKNLCYECYQQ